MCVTIFATVLCLQPESSLSVLSPRLAAVGGSMTAVGDLDLGGGSSAAPTGAEVLASRVRAASGADASSLAGAHSSLNTFTKMTLDEYVKVKGGNRVINKILIANNGIAAVKAIRSMRRSVTQPHNQAQRGRSAEQRCTAAFARVSPPHSVCLTR